MSKTLSEQSLIDPTASVSHCELGRYTEVGARTKLLEVALGDYSYVVNDSDIAYATIGKFCSIAAMTRINPGNHPMERASQSHFTYRSSMYFRGERDDGNVFDWRRAHRVTIGHDVWIGHGAIILPGRNVGTGAVVAAGAIVTKDVADYMIVAGNPARPVRERFPAAVVERMRRLAWWEWTHERLRLALPDFRTMTAAQFLEKYDGAGARGGTD
jgi:phosphonate metabolism protein (transferase hexapeptide repeat family)